MIVENINDREGRIQVDIMERAFLYQEMEMVSDWTE
jgi:hypothetical protein